MNYQILDQTPLKDKRTEINYGHHFRSSCWVKFYYSIDDYWYACFGSSEIKNIKAKVQIANDFALITYNGKLFLINLYSKNLIMETEENIDIKNAIIDGNREIVIYPHKDRVVIYDYKTYKIKMIKLDSSNNNIVIKKFDTNFVFGSFNPFDDFLINFKINIDSEKIMYKELIIHSKILFIDKYNIFVSNDYTNEEYYKEENKRPTTAST